MEQEECKNEESAASFGSVQLNDQTDVLLKCNEICNIYGLDTISAGMTIAWRWNARKPSAERQQGKNFLKVGFYTAKNVLT